MADSYILPEFSKNIGSITPIFEHNTISSQIKNMFGLHSNADYSLSQNLIWPPDLQDNSTKRSTIVFHINVIQDSQFYGEYGATSDIPIKKSTNRIGTNIYGAGDSLGSVVQTIGHDAAYGLFKMSDGSDSATQNYIERANMAKGAGDWTKDLIQRTSKPLKRLRGSIMMYMPTNVNTSYGVRYADESMGLFGALAEHLSSNDSNKLKIAMETGSQALMRIGANVIGQGAANMIGAFGVDSSIVGNPGAVIDAATKTTFNPRKEQLFKEVGFREFNYSFDFAPQTREDCNTIISIINTFKFHMHPEIDPTRFFYMFPSEFDIEYYDPNGKKNEFLNSINSCALTDLRINYSPGESWSTLVNGCPTHIKITLSFLELQPLTKDLIKEGGY